MRLPLALCLVLLAGCANEPYTPAPKIAPVSLKPIQDSNEKLRTQNAGLKAGNQTIKDQLDRAKADLESEIAARNAQSGAAATATKNVENALSELNKAREEAAKQDARIDDQMKEIASQATTITLKNNELTDRQKEIDRQTNELNDLRKYRAEEEAQKKLDKRWWGIGGILRWTGYLGWHVLIVLAVLAALSFALNALLPGVRPFFAMVVGFLKNLWPFRKKPPP